MAANVKYDKETDTVLTFMAKMSEERNFNARSLSFNMLKSARIEEMWDAPRTQYRATLNAQAKEPHNQIDVCGELCDTREAAIEIAKKAFNEAMPT